MKKKFAIYSLGGIFCTIGYYINIYGYEGERYMATQDELNDGCKRGIKLYSSKTRANNVAKEIHCSNFDNDNFEIHKIKVLDDGTLERIEEKEGESE